MKSALKYDISLEFSVYNVLLCSDKSLMSSSVNGISWKT